MTTTPESRRQGTPKAPIVGGELWTAVMERAGYQCQCDQAACGKKVHSHSTQRKRDASGKYPTDRCPLQHIYGRPLLAVPANPDATTTEAAALDAPSLVAMCGDCAKGREAIANRNRRAQLKKQLDEAQDSLFADEEIHTVTKKEKPQL